MSSKQWIVCFRTLGTLHCLLVASQLSLVEIYNKPFLSLEIDQGNRLSGHVSLDLPYSTTPNSFSSLKTCALQTIRIQQSLNLHNFSWTLDLERTCLLMVMSRYPMTSASMAPPFSHSSSTYIHLSTLILLLSQNTS